MKHFLQIESMVPSRFVRWANGFEVYGITFPQGQMA
jgi:hypothetical protein